MLGLHAITHSLGDLLLGHGSRNRGTFRDDRGRKCATENNSGQLRAVARIGSDPAIEGDVVW